VDLFFRTCDVVHVIKSSPKRKQFAFVVLQTVKLNLQLFKFPPNVQLPKKKTVIFVPPSWHDNLQLSTPPQLIALIDSTKTLTLSTAEDVLTCAQRSVTNFPTFFPLLSFGKLGAPL
jgi:hypothetical protein